MPAVATGRRRSNNGTVELSAADAATALAKFPFRFQVVPISEMFVDTSYQRPLTSLASEIENHFNPALVMTLCLSVRSNGKYAVMDGQTRMVGCEKLGLEALPALVYEGLTKADEAQIFELIQTARRNVTSFYRFRASVQAKNPRSLAIVALIKDLDTDWTIGLGDGEIKSVAALEYGYDLDPTALERALLSLKEAWSATSTENKTYVPDGRFIRALTLYYHLHSDADDERVVRRLKANAPRDLQVAADHLQASRAVKPPGGRSKYGFLQMAISNAVGR
jgi:hypothetical protein